MKKIIGYLIVYGIFILSCVFTILSLYDMFSGNKDHYSMVSFTFVIILILGGIQGFSIMLGKVLDFALNLTKSPGEDNFTHCPNCNNNLTRETHLFKNNKKVCKLCGWHVEFHKETI